MLTKLRIKLRQLYFKDTQFANLMTKRIFNVLLVANPYDAFMLEDDGRIDEKIFNEYMNLSLRYPPRFTQVSTAEETWEQLRNTMFDLVICMPGSDNSDTFDIARDIKKEYPHLPLVVLTPFSHGIKERMEHEDLSIFEYVFCWLGNTDLLVSIIKLIEDKMNLEHDIKEVGVQMIMLDVLTPIFFIRMEYAAQTKAAPSARISPAGFSSRTKAPFAMMRKIPVKAAAKPRKKRREKPSPFSRK